MNIIKLTLTICFSSLLFGCTMVVKEKKTPSYTTESIQVEDKIVKESVNYLGIPYKYGGDNPIEGFDCSGFVKYIYQKVAKLEVPRTTTSQLKIGKPIKMTNIQKGDLIFFGINSKYVNHVGIYIGDNQFIHAPSTGSTVRVEKVTSSYWSKKIRGVRRPLNNQI